MVIRALVLAAAVTLTLCHNNTPKQQMQQDLMQQIAEMKEERRKQEHLLEMQSRMMRQQVSETFEEICA